MNIDTFRLEAEALARPAVLLRESGEGDPLAFWHGAKANHSCISIRQGDAWLNVSLDHTYTGGHAQLAPNPITSPIPLYGQSFTCLPPVDAVFLLGSQKIGDFLAEHDWPRDEPYNRNFPNSVPEQYEIQWQESYPLYQSGIDAVLGGWHMFWPDGDWHDLLSETLVAWTLRDCEPWVEIWRHGDAYTVKQRIT